MVPVRVWASRPSQYSKQPESLIHQSRCEEVYHANLSLSLEKPSASFHACLSELTSCIGVSNLPQKASSLHLPRSPLHSPIQTRTFPELLLSSNHSTAHIPPKVEHHYAYNDHPANEPSTKYLGKSPLLSVTHCSNGPFHFSRNL